MKTIRLATMMIALSFAQLIWAQERTRFIQPESRASSSDDGTIHLAWESVGGPDTVYEVRRSRDAGFESEPTLVYEGQDTATFVSGLPEGEFHFKVRSKRPDGAYPEWPQESVVLKVEYIDAGLVVLLMAAGFVTFLAIVGAIFLGHKKVEQTA